MAERVHTIRPGEMRAEEIGAPRHVVPGSTEPIAHGDPWVARLMVLADHVIAQVPASGGGSRLGLALAVLYLLVVAQAAAFGAHLVSDGTVRAKVNRTECLVEWLVSRAVAEDRGQPAPHFDPLGCRER